MIGSGAEISHKRLLRIAFPIVIANATVPLLGAVDVAVIGQIGLPPAWARPVWARSS